MSASGSAPEGRVGTRAYGAGTDLVAAQEVGACLRGCPSGEAGRRRQDQTRPPLLEILTARPESGIALAVLPELGFERGDAAISASPMTGVRGRPGGADDQDSSITG